MSDEIANGTTVCVSPSFLSSDKSRANKSPRRFGCLVCIGTVYTTIAF